MSNVYHVDELGIQIPQKKHAIGKKMFTTLQIFRIKKAHSLRNSMNLMQSKNKIKNSMYEIRNTRSSFLCQFPLLYR